MDLATCGKIRKSRASILYWQRWKVAAVVFVALVAGACTSKCGCTEPRTITTAQLTNRPESSSVQAANQLVIYLDTSASMAGFVGSNREKETRFSRTLQELRNFVTLINPPPDVLVRRVDVTVSEPLNNMMLSQASVDSSLFNGADTDLAGAINAFEQPIANKAPARFHILVTDGVQSTNQQHPVQSCVSGSDEICVRRKIFELLNKGWGAYVLASRSEFHGNIYSEVNRAQHRPSTLRFDTTDDTPASFRPFYLYIFSPDRDAIDSFVRTLLERLRAVVGKDAGSLHVLSLTSAYVNGPTQAESMVPKSGSTLLRIRKKDTKDLPEFEVIIDPETAQKGAQAFTLTMTLPWISSVLTGATSQELASLIDWQLVQVYPKSPEVNARYPEIKVTGQSFDESGRLQLQASAQWPAAVGTLCWGGYRLEGRLKPQAMTPEWVRAWSTNLDTTVENGNRTLYLETVLLGLWRNPIIDKQLVAEAALIAGPSK